MKFPKFLMALLCATALFFGASVKAQDVQPFSSGELDALLAPIALYPDALVAQVLMASTYPLEVVEADRFSKSKKLSGDAAIKAAENERWDVSVKSLTAFPNVLDMMSAQLSWTQQLGDAFLDQQVDVMDSIQRLRVQAQKAGNLQSGGQQIVKSEGQIIIIEPAQPQVIYVPAYNPNTVYGTWGYPTYPPTYYAPSSNWYPGQTIVKGFMWGVGFSAANALFGGFGWNDKSVNVNVNRAVHIDRSVTNNNFGNNGRWSHDSRHRGNTAYRSQNTQSRFAGKADSVSDRRDAKSNNTRTSNSREAVSDKREARATKESATPAKQAAKEKATARDAKPAVENARQAEPAKAAKAAKAAPARETAPTKAASARDKAPAKKAAKAENGGKREAVKNRRD